MGPGDRPAEVIGSVALVAAAGRHHDSLKWGDVPTWFAAVGGVFALFFTARTSRLQKRALDQQSAQLRDERSARHALESREQARDEAARRVQIEEHAHRVGAYLSGGGPTRRAAFHLTNSGVFPVVSFEAVAYAEEGRRIEIKRDYIPRVVTPIWIVPPGGPYTTPLVLPADASWHLEIAFTDENGNRWHKYGPQGRLVQVGEDFSLP